MRHPGAAHAAVGTEREGTTPSVEALLDSLPTPAVLATHRGRALRWNARAAGFLQWPEYAGEGRKLFPARALWLRRACERALAGGRSQVHLRRGGRPLRATFIATEGTDGTRFLVCLEPRLSRGRIFEALQQSQRRWSDLVDFSPDAVVIHDECIRYANPAACRMIGAERPSDVIGRPVHDFVHPEDRAAVTLPRRLPERPRSRRRDLRLVRLDGQVIDAEVVAMPIPWHGSTAVQLVVRDVTRQRRAEHGLRISQERFRLLADGVRGHAIVMLDDDGAVVSWNRGAERLMGRSAEDVVGRPLGVLFTEEDVRTGRPDRLLGGAGREGRCEDEGWCVRADGERFWASTAVTALQDPEGQLVGFALIVRDLTERREAEAALRRSEDHLRQAQKMEGIGRLAGGIAHDFNNLLTAIQGHAQFLLEDLPEDHHTRSDAEEIRRAADRAAALTRQLLAFSRRQVLQPQIIDLNSVIRDMNRMLRRVIREDVALATALADNTWSTYADAGQIEQILMNLVVNARDAMPEGGSITVATGNIEIGEGYAVAGAGPEPGDYVQLTVSDTGVGMDKDTQARIFEPFFTTKPEGEGTGLGLSTVYGIVQQSGGHITVYSEPGRGTTFRILMPRHYAAGEVPQAPRRAAPPAADGWESVLLVEDDPAVRALTRRILLDRGYSVLEAGDGPEALRLAREFAGAIDLLVTDIVMPEMSGRKLAESLRSFHPTARVLFMSGFTESDVLQQGLLEPGAVFVEKPFSPDGLAACVREALERERDTPEHQAPPA